MLSRPVGTPWLTATCSRQAKAVMAGLLSIPLLSVASLSAPLPQSANSAAVANPADTVSLDQYRGRLQQLRQLVAGCQQAMSPALCESDRVGPDVTISLPDGPREIRFGWLRTLLDQVAHPDAAREDSDKSTTASATPAGKDASQKPLASAKPPNQTRPAKPEMAQPEQAKPEQAKPEQAKPEQAKPVQDAQEQADRNPRLPLPEDVIGISVTPNIFKRLDSARRRLEQDDRWAEQRAASPVIGTVTGLATDPAHSLTVEQQTRAAQHRALNAILATKEYRNASAGPTIKDRVLEKIANWIDTVLGELVKAGSKSKWIGLTAEIGFIALLCIALVWLLIRIERQGRFGAPSIGLGPTANSASARDWQLWLADAKQSADRSEWRDAIHSLYWASISRLESSGLWPADRARTPREYLALLSSQSAKHPHLIALTRSLEYTWYAGHPAAEADYHRAKQLAGSLDSSLASSLASSIAPSIAADLSSESTKGVISR